MKFITTYFICVYTFVLKGLQTHIHRVSKKLFFKIEGGSNPKVDDEGDNNCQRQNLFLWG